MATKKAMYGYTVRDDADPRAKDQSGEKFDEKALRRNEAQLVVSDKPDRRSMRFLGTGDSPNLRTTNVGGGRAEGVGGATAREMKVERVKQAVRAPIDEAVRHYKGFANSTKQK